MQPGAIAPSGGRHYCCDNNIVVPFLGNRHMNHASGSRANLRPHPPLMVNGMPRVAFLASRDIKSGEELLWDYGVNLKGFIDNNKKKVKKVCFTVCLMQ